MRGQLLGLIQLVVADKVAALDDLGLIRKLLVPFAQALRLDHLSLSLVAPSCRIIDVDLEFLRAWPSQVGLGLVGLLELLLKKLLIYLGDVLGDDLRIRVRSLCLSGVLAHVLLLLVAEVVHLLYLMHLLLLHVAARAGPPIIVG